MCLFLICNDRYNSYLSVMTEKYVLHALCRQLVLNGAKRCMRSHQTKWQHMESFYLKAFTVQRGRDAECMLNLGPN